METFMGCQIVDMDDSETISIDTMVLDKTLTVWYTYSDKQWVSGSPGSPYSSNV